jgi:hypothetical protein
MLRFLRFLRFLGFPRLLRFVSLAEVEVEVEVEAGTVFDAVLMLLLRMFLGC